MYFQDIITQLHFPVPPPFSAEEAKRIEKFMEGSHEVLGVVIMIY